MESNNLENLRHSCAHLLAAAVMELWPDTKRAIGPAIENGFYYDFEFAHPISESDFPKIEQKMHELVKNWQGFERKEVSKEEALQLADGNQYKEELINEFASEGQTLTYYKSGDFLDLCRGGHVENPSRELNHFKLLSVAGAYWRGDEKNKMLTRIYGTCFPTSRELDHYLWQLEEAKKRDHKKLGKEMELFIISPEIGGGLPIFSPKGLTTREIISNYLVRKKREAGYQFVWTPHIAKAEIYRKSGHLGKYDAMFNPLELDDEKYILKPMNCPHHFQVYLNKPRSYRDLPLRIAENGTVYRYEKSGELNGLLRVRAATIDDTHTFVRGDSIYIEKEVKNVVSLTKSFIHDFGFSNYRVRISVRDKNNLNKYIGDQKLWDVAEKALERVAHEENIPSFIGEGEAAFYGPKLDFMIRDAIGREWQCSTIQLDFHQPVNFGMEYIDEDGKPHRPAILHIAMIGSIERFMGILIEHYAGAFPVWLAPIQVAVLPISEKHREFAKQVAQHLERACIRTEFNDSNESIGKKIRESTLQKVPFMVIIGEKEIASSDPDRQKFTISVRTREGEDQGQQDINEFINTLSASIEKYQ